MTADDRMKYDAQFYQLQPVAGFLTGTFILFSFKLVILQFVFAFRCIIK